MSIAAPSATPDSLAEIVESVASWQHSGGPVQLHPGDLGWHWRFGPEVLAAALRVWRRDGQLVAVGMMDGPGLIRLALAPDVDADHEFAVELVADLSDAAQGVESVEARSGTAFRDRLHRSGWTADEPWTPLCRNLDTPVEPSDLEVEVVDAHGIEDRVAVHRESFPHSRFTSWQWQAMAAAPPYRRARCLVGRDRHGDAVGAVTVWSAGPGRPGLLEPMGVHRDHRGHGYGRAITVAAASALRQLGSSTATVCTPSSNGAAVATYLSAGFRRLPDVTDFRRPDRSLEAAGSMPPPVG